MFFITTCLKLRLIAPSPPDFISLKTRIITLCVWSDLEMMLSRSCFLFVRNLDYFIFARCSKKFQWLWEMEV